MFLINLVIVMTVKSGLDSKIEEINNCQGVRDFDCVDSSSVYRDIITKTFTLKGSMRRIISSLYPLIFFIVFSIILFPGKCFSDSVSTTSAQFLEIPAGVRGAGMGDTFSAIADDISTTYWNTAGLAQLESFEVNLLHVSYFESTNYEFAGIAIPIKPGSTLGLTSSFDFIPSFNSTNNPSATPGSANDLAIELGFGQTFGDNFALGIGGKYISSNLVSYSATGEAVDAGLLLYTARKDLTFGLSVQNVGQVSSFSQYSTQEKLPLVYRAGLAYRFQPRKSTNFVLGIDIEKPIDSDPVVHTGGELWLGSKNLSVAIRGGYSFNSLNQDLGGITGASLGAGLKVNPFEFDYAYVPFGALGDTQRFSLTYRFGNELPEPVEEKKSVSVQIQPQIEDIKTGSLKQATFDIKPMARTDIKNWTLEITDPKGNIIRSYTGKGVPPKQIAWDGKDTNGNIVTGGIFANYNFRTVDVKGQQVVATEPIFKVGQVSGRENPVMASAAAETGAAMVELQENSVPTLSPSTQPLGLSGVIKVPSVSFNDRSSKLGNNFFTYLDQVAKMIRKYPNARVYIEGHSYDEGSEEENLQISQNRADSVLRYLIEKGKVSPENIYARGHGDSAPLDTSDTEVAHFRNRRVDIVILTK